MTVFGRLGRLFLVVGVAGVILGVVGVVTEVLGLTIAGFVVGGTFLVLGLVFTMVQRSAFGDPAALEQVLSSGVPTVGEVRGISPMTGRINADPLMRLSIAIGGREVTVRTRVPIMHLTQIAVGARLPVLVHPNHPDVAIIDWAKLPPPHV